MYLQRALGLTDSDVDSIETRLALQATEKGENKQPGILSSKKARRSVLLGSTALGLVSIFSSYSLTFWLGNIVILFGGAFVVFAGQVQDLAPWRRKTLAVGAAIAMLLWLVNLNPSICLYNGGGYACYKWLRLTILIYLTSIYIGRW